jgi:hypothetical protein
MLAFGIVTTSSIAQSARSLRNNVVKRYSTGVPNTAANSYLVSIGEKPKGTRNTVSYGTNIKLLPRMMAFV